MKVLKVSKVLLDKSKANQTSKLIRDKVTPKNCILCLFFSQIFRHQEVFKTSLHIIERWFTTVADSENFLELDLTLVATILNSSELLIDSELEVFNVLTAWLNYKRIERSKHAKNLLQKVRLSLLTVPALNNILDKNLWIAMNDECSEVIKKVIEYKNKLPFNIINNLPPSRYCSQNNFDIVIVGGVEKFERQVVRDAFTVDCTDFFTVDSLPIINYRRYYLKTVCNKGEIYVFGGIDDNNNPVIAVEKYSSTANTWNFITQMNDNREGFCACSFIDSIYVI